MNNPKTDPTDPSLAALAQQTALFARSMQETQDRMAAELRKLSSAIEGRIAERSGAPQARPIGSVVKTSVHPLQDAILAVLADGKAHLKTKLADTIPGANRSSVHYHCKRMRIQGLIRDVAIGVDGHDVDYVIAAEHCPPIPGIDSSASAKPRKA